MQDYNPDPIVIDVLWQGKENPYRVRLELPDGSTYNGVLDLDSLLTRLDKLDPVWRSEDPSEYGRVLFKYLFSEPLDYYYEAALGEAGERGIRLLLRLDEQNPRLHTIPWERLYHPQRGDWLPVAAAPNIYFSRYLSTGGAWGLPRPAGPVRMLIVVSCPYPPGHELYLDANQECENIFKAFAGFEDRVEYEILAGPVTLEALANKLDEGAGFDILHYIGHGAWKADEGLAYLILEEPVDGGIRPKRVSEREITDRLRLVRCLPRLICLAACDSAQQSTTDAFIGLGPGLVLTGCPAVICMHGRIEVAVEQQFTQNFFAQLFEHGIVDLAVNLARQTVHEHWAWQWTVPVLFMRLPNGVLFRPQQRLQPSERKPYKGLSPFTPEDRDLFYGRSDEILDIYRRICDSSMAIISGETDVGLTSLMEAGIRPRLEQDGNLVVTVSSYRDLTATFRTNLRVKRQPLRLHVPGNAPLPEVLQAVYAACVNTFDHLVLILDQFERAFELPDEVQKSLIMALTESLKTMEAYLRLVFVLRRERLSEFLDLLQPLQDWGREMVSVKQLNEANAEAAVVEPLEALGWPVTLSPRLLARDQIVPDLAELSGETSRVEPSCLQIVCNWLYREALKPKMAHTITADLYNAAKGAEGIMARYMEEILTALGGEQQLAEQILAYIASGGIEFWVSAEQLALNDNSVKRQEVLGRLVEADLLVERYQDDRYEYALTNRAVAEQANQLRSSEEQRRVEEELKRIWSAWLARDALATSGQLRYLRYLTEQGAQPKLEPVQALLLLRSAITRDEATQLWLEQLCEAGGGDLIRQLENCHTEEMKKDCYNEDEELKTRSGRSTLEKAACLLGLRDECLPPLPEDAEGPFGNIAWSAITHCDSAVRQTAAVALATLKPHKVIDRLRWALQTGTKGWQRRERRAELRAVLADADPEIEKIRTDLSHLDRVWIWWWRMRRYIWRDRNRIFGLTLGGAVGAGLGLGLLRGGTATLLSSGFTPRLEFAIHVWWGMILGAALVLGMTLAEAFLLGRIQTPPRISSVWRSPLHPDRLLALLIFGLATLFFSLGHLAVAWLIGLSATRVLPIATYGLTAGLGLSLALSGQPRLGWRLRMSQVLLRLVGTVIAFVLPLLFFIIIAGDEFEGLSIVWSSQTYYADFPRYTKLAFWLEEKIPSLFDILTLLDAALVGIVLAIGTTAGMLLAAKWLARWRDLSDQAWD